MQISARNRLKGKIINIHKGETVCSVTVELPDKQQVVSTITTESVNRLGLKENDEVEAIIKASDVMIAKE